MFPSYFHHISIIESYPTISHYISIIFPWSHWDPIRSSIGASGAWLAEKRGASAPDEKRFISWERNWCPQDWIWKTDNSTMDANRLDTWKYWGYDIYIYTPLSKPLPTNLSFVGIITVYVQELTTEYIRQSLHRCWLLLPSFVPIYWSKRTILR